MSKTQEELFSGGEADRWFQRNASAMEARCGESSDAVSELLHEQGVRPRAVLEVGCSNGYRLELLRRRNDCRSVGVEPSLSAIEDGRRRYPQVTFHQATAETLPLPDRAFDLVLLPGVLCWVGRGNLLRAVSEADRVLEENGLLVIADFLPLQAERVAYHHLPEAGLFTYKQNYAAIFLATHCYELLCCTVLDHTLWKPNPGSSPIIDLR